MSTPEILLPDLATQINDEHHSVEQAALKGLQHAWQAGKLLMLAKSAVHHGGWGAWVESNCVFSYRTARVYLQLATKIPSLDDPKWQHAASLPVRDVLALLAEKKTNEILIDPEFSKLLPPHRPEESSLIEASILKTGCLVPLVVWNGVLVDGHKRYEICTRHGIPFKTFEIEFADRNAAAKWIYTNQLARVNLSPEEFKHLSGLLSRE